MSVVEFSKKMDIPLNSVYRYMRKENIPSRRTIQKLMERSKSQITLEGLIGTKNEK